MKSPTSKSSVFRAATLAGLVSCFASVAFAGATYTTNSAGTIVNQNIYTDPLAVYMSGGPQNTSANGSIPDGVYRFDICGTNENNILSTDAPSNRYFTILNGVVTGTSGTHALGSFNGANGQRTVQMAPFNPSSNGEYKLVIRNPSILDNQGNPSKVKSDNFKIEAAPASLTISALDKTICAVGRNGAIVTYGYSVLNPSGGYTVTASDGHDSGTVFFNGQTVVTLTVIDSQNNTSSCQLTITVKSMADGECETDTNPLNNNIALEGCHKKYSAADFDNAIGLSGGAYYLLSGTQLVSVPFGTLGYEPPFGPNVTVVYFTVGSAVGTIELTNNDTEAPRFTSIPGVASTDPNTNITTYTISVDSCNSVVPFVATATDCSEFGVVYTLANGDEIRSPYDFPLGSTVVNVKATDILGQYSTASFTVTVSQAMGTIKVTKYYDSNGNGARDDGEPTVAGFKIQVNGGTAQYTGLDGSTTFSVPIGPSAVAYTVTETAPNTSWVNSYTIGATSVSLSCSNPTAAVTFGNYQLGSRGGLTLGFWSNKNGAAAMNGKMGTLLSTYYLREASGLRLSTSSNLAAFQKFLTSAAATNMANMLSAQFSAMYLNVNGASSSPVGGSWYIQVGTGFMTVNDLLAASAAQLAIQDATSLKHISESGRSVPSTVDRALEEKYKTALDNGNNNKPVYIMPAPVTSLPNY